MSWAETLCLGLLLSAVIWRVSSLLHSESPLDWLRKWLGVKQNTDDPYTWFWPSGFIGDTLSCFWCTSLYIALLASAILTVSGYTGIIQGVILWLSSAAGAIMVERFIGRSKARW